MTSLRNSVIKLAYMTQDKALKRELTSILKNSKQANRSEPGEWIYELGSSFSKIRFTVGRFADGGMANDWAKEVEQEVANIVSKHMRSRRYTWRTSVDRRGFVKLNVKIKEEFLTPKTTKWDDIHKILFRKDIKNDWRQALTKISKIEGAKPDFMKLAMEKIDSESWSPKVQFIPAADYKKGDFGYWWTIEEGNENIEAKDYRGDIVCSEKNLTSLRGAPVRVSGAFDCGSNKLTSLEYGPRIVEGSYYCAHNKLTNLKGGPVRTGGRFSCSNNNLTSLKGGPERTGLDFSCDNNKLTSLKHAPKVVGGHFWGANNSREFTKEDVKAVSKLNGSIRV